jgi:hypothetical protein
VFVGEGLHHIFGGHGEVGDGFAGDDGDAGDSEIEHFVTGAEGRGQRDLDFVLTGGNAGAAEAEAARSVVQLKADLTVEAVVA